MKFNLILAFLNQNSGAIQGIATVVLVVVTIYYAIQTKRTVVEMREARRYEFLPIVEIEAQAINLNKLRITIGNIGKGLARTPKIHIPTIDSVTFQNMGPRTTREEIFTLDPVAILALPDDQRKIKVEYLDVFSRQMSSEALLIAETTEAGNPRRNHLAIGTWNLTLPN